MILSMNHMWYKRRLPGSSMRRVACSYCHRTLATSGSDFVLVTMMRDADLDTICNGKQLVTLLEAVL